jgi:hypothetical protein
VVNLGRIRKNPRLQIRRNHLEYWNDEEFYIRFTSKNTVVLLLEEIRENIQHNTNSPCLKSSFSPSHTRFKLVHFSFNTFASRLMPSIVCELNERAMFPHIFVFSLLVTVRFFFLSRQLLVKSPPTSPIKLFHC